MVMANAIEASASSAENRGGALAALLSVTLHLLAVFILWHWHGKPLAAPDGTGFVMELVPAVDEASGSPPPAVAQATPETSATQPVAPQPVERSTAPTLVRPPQARSPQRHISQAAPKSTEAAQPTPGSGSAATPVSAPQADAGGESAAAHAIEQPHPSYPPLARRMHQEGEVMILAQIGADGTVQSASVEQSSGFALLDEAATTALMRWRFAPALEKGQPTTSMVRIPVRFNLND